MGQCLSGGASKKQDKLTGVQAAGGKTNATKAHTNALAQSTDSAFVGGGFDTILESPSGEVDLPPAADPAHPGASLIRRATGKEQASPSSSSSSGADSSHPAHSRCGTGLAGGTDGEAVASTSAPTPPRPTASERRQRPGPKGRSSHLGRRRGASSTGNPSDGEAVVALPLTAEQMAAVERALSSSLKGPGFAKRSSPPPSASAVTGSGLEPLTCEGSSTKDPMLGPFGAPAAAAVFAECDDGAVATAMRGTDSMPRAGGGGGGGDSAIAAAAAAAASVEPNAGAFRFDPAFLASLRSGTGSVALPGTGSHLPPQPSRASLARPSLGTALASAVAEAQAASETPPPSGRRAATAADLPSQGPSRRNGGVAGEASEDGSLRLSAAHSFTAVGRIGSATGPHSGALPPRPDSGAASRVERTAAQPRQRTGDTQPSLGLGGASLGLGLGLPVPSVGLGASASGAAAADPGLQTLLSLGLVNAAAYRQARRRGSETGSAMGTPHAVGPSGPSLAHMSSLGPDFIAAMRGDRKGPGQALPGRQAATDAGGPRRQRRQSFTESGANATQSPTQAQAQAQAYYLQMPRQPAAEGGRRQRRLSYVESSAVVASKSSFNADQAFGMIRRTGSVTVTGPSQAASAAAAAASYAAFMAAAAAGGGGGAGGQTGAKRGGKQRRTSWVET